MRVKLNHAVRCKFLLFNGLRQSIIAGQLPKSQTPSTSVTLAVIPPAGKRAPSREGSKTKRAGQVGRVTLEGKGERLWLAGVFMDSKVPWILVM